MKRIIMTLLVLISILIMTSCAFSAANEGHTLNSVDSSDTVLLAKGQPTITVLNSYVEGINNIHISLLLKDGNGKPIPNHKINVKYYRAREQDDRPTSFPIFTNGEGVVNVVISDPASYTFYFDTTVNTANGPIDVSLQYHS